LRDYLLKNATAITVRRFDWCPLYQVEADGYGIGVHLRACLHKHEYGRLQGCLERNQKCIPAI